MAQAQIESIKSFSVEKQFISDDAARKLIEKPVEIKGSNLSITIIIPLLEQSRNGKSPYLVAKLPKEQVEELKSIVDKLPEKQRAQFITDYIKYKQKHIIDAYYASKSDKFVVNVKPSSNEIIDPWKSKPIRVVSHQEIQDPWKGARPEKRENPNPGELVSPWKAEQREVGEKPTKEEKPKENQITIPDVHVTAVPKVRNDKKLPKEIVGGEGTQTNRYQVYRTRKEVDKLLENDQIEKTPAVLPIKLEMESGTFYFYINFTLDQLTKKNLEKTLNDLSRILTETMKVKGVPPTEYTRKISSGVNTYVREKILEIHKTQTDVGKYLRSN